MVGKPKHPRDWSKERVSEAVIYHLNQVQRAHKLYDVSAKDYIFDYVAHIIHGLIYYHEHILRYGKRLDSKLPGYDPEQ